VSITKKALVEWYIPLVDTDKYIGDNENKNAEIKETNMLLVNLFTKRYNKTTEKDAINIEVISIVSSGKKLNGLSSLWNPNVINGYIMPPFTPPWIAFDFKLSAYPIRSP